MTIVNSAGTQYITLTDGYLQLNAGQFGLGAAAVNRSIQIISNNLSAGGLLQVDIHGNLSIGSGGGGGITTLTGDVSATGTGSVAAEVIGIQNKTLPTLATGYLNYNGTAFAYTALPTSLPPNGSAGGALSGTYPNPTITSLPVADLAAGTSAQILLNSATPTPTWTTVSGDATISSAGAVTVKDAQSGLYVFNTTSGTNTGQAAKVEKYVGFCQTTDGSTVKNALVIAIPNGQTMLATITLVGRLHSGVTTYAQLIFGGAENASGTAALFTGSGHVNNFLATLYDTAFAAAGISGNGAVLAVSGANFEVTIAGVSSTTIDWQCCADVIFV